MVKPRSCSVAIFAHNIENSIVDCITSVLASQGELDLNIYVLANGCTDKTCIQVEDSFKENKRVHLVTISMADKANAWNHYVHHIAVLGTPHFFVDGDVVLTPDALRRLLESLHAHPFANAVGAVPNVGRDREGWISRMKKYGRVSGGLYALSTTFVDYIVTNQIKLPVGFVGDDFLVSAWAKDLWGMEGLYLTNPKLVINPLAFFTFRQLSLSRIGDAKAYFRRLLRYRLRDYQLGMLMHYFETQGIEHIPLSVAEIYRLADSPPSYQWCGKSTLIDWLAVHNIRKVLFNELEKGAK